MYKGIVYEVINRARSYLLMRNVLSAFVKAKKHEVFSASGCRKQPLRNMPKNAFFNILIFNE